MKIHSEKFLKTRKFLMVLPLLTLPFVTLAFWAMGGGQGKGETAVVQQKGFNKELPGAQLTGASLDKMSMYNQTDKDSAALHQQMGNDPYALTDNEDSMAEAATNGYVATHSYSGGMQTYTDPNEAKVRERLASLERSLNQPASATTSYDQRSGQPSVSMNGDLDRLERMMKSMSGGVAADPEMQQLDGMLEKIMAIQNPELARQQLQEKSQANKGHVYVVTKHADPVQTSLINSSSTGQGTKPLPGIVKPQPTGNAFYNIDELNQPDTLTEQAIAAVIHETQTLVTGGTLKIRLTDDIYINGALIPKGQFLFGTASVNGERLKVHINTLRYKNKVFPVALSMFDLDGLEGIRIPGAINRDAAKDGADRALQNVQLMSLDPSLAAQAAGTGVEIAKGLFSKKAKLVRVTVKAGHPVLLLDQKSLQQ